METVRKSSILYKALIMTMDEKQVNLFDMFIACKDKELSEFYDIETSDELADMQVLMDIERGKKKLLIRMLFLLGPAYIALVILAIKLLSRI